MVILKILIKVEKFRTGGSYFEEELKPDILT
jgi:hypothetical protein